MVKKLALFLLLSCLLPGQMCMAAEIRTCVFDEAGLFSQDEADRIDEEIQTLSSETDMDYVVLTISDAAGKTSQEYADDYYEDTGFGTHGNYSGMLYLIDMDNREICISAEGDMMRYLTDERVDVVLDHAFEEVSDGNYAESALLVLQDVGSYVASGIPENQYHYSSESENVDPHFQISFPPLALLFGLASGLAAALGTFFTVKGKYQLTSETYRYPLSEKSDLKLTVSEDRLINQFVTHRRIPKNPPPASGGQASGRQTSAKRTSSGRTSSARASSGRASSIRTSSARTSSGRTSSGRASSGRASSGRTTTHRSGSGRVHSGGSRKF